MLLWLLFVLSFNGIISCFFTEYMNTKKNEFIIEITLWQIHQIRVPPRTPAAKNTCRSSGQVVRPTARRGNPSPATEGVRQDRHLA